jgi:N-acetylglucosamine kinase-like BadF-type ATPase
MSPLYLGIDGGQSSTTALIADETGRIIGRGHGGPCNHVGSAERRAKFMSVVGECLRTACAEAALDPAAVSFAAACLGFSGGSEDKESCSRELIRAAKYKFTHDAEIALTGATAGAPGMIVIAGTGSMAFGRNASGVAARAGGWGYLFGDEGGAFDLIRRALRAALQQEEGWGRPTALRDLLLGATHTPDANMLMHRFYNEFSRSAIASLAPLVTRAAEQGDPAADEIVRGAAHKLGWYVRGVYGQLFQARESVAVTYIGGVFQSTLLLDAFTRQIRESIGCPAVAPRFGPAAGAVLEALRLDDNRASLSAVPESEK